MEGEGEWGGEGVMGVSKVTYIFNKTAKYKAEVEESMESSWCVNNTSKG